MSAPPSPSSALPLSPDADLDNDADYPPSLPLPLTASLTLSHLPHDATTALALASTAFQSSIPEKVKIRFQPIGSAPPLTQKVFKISSGSRFESVVGFLRRKLGLGKGGGELGSVFCYVNSVFAPGLDEGVGGLWKGGGGGWELLCVGGDGL
ncbi:Ubiquitin-like protein [Ptychographa xylographoides]|nr:Ubiquitin-like protein [Ptychographa xylographoides]